MRSCGPSPNNPAHRGSMSTLNCSAAAPAVTLRQKRYLPIGSKADPNVTWHVPVCMRFDADGRVHEQCTVLTQPNATIAARSAATARPG